jgi:hypothetical protein
LIRQQIAHFATTLRIPSLPLIIPAIIPEIDFSPATREMEE